MTNVYFVRHAATNFNNHNDFTRELTTQGIKDRKLVTQFLQDKEINVIFSSPYKRAVDTVKEFADAQNIQIELVSDFRERKVGGSWIEDFGGFCRKQWEDFNFKLPDGESLREVQERNIRALHGVLEAHAGENIAVGSHGTALSTIINYFDPSFDYNEFTRIKNLMPWIVKFSFDGDGCTAIEKCDLFS